MRRRLLALVTAGALLVLAFWRLRTDPDPRLEVTHQWPVMGTFFTVAAYALDSTTANAAAAAAGRAVFRVDSLMSTWQPASEISRLNQAAGTKEWTPLSPETLAVLLAARSLSEASGGSFDVTVGPLMQAWGFRGDGPRLPEPAVRASARDLVGYRALELDSAGGRARLGRVGMAVDLGAIAKGYALDLAAAAMRGAGARAGSLDLGGNVLVFGAPPGGREEWLVGVLDPREPGATIGEIRLRQGSAATSGDYEQFFEADGVRYSHIMDARRGEPARGVLQTTVVAPTGLQADGLSTTLFVLGPEAGRALLAGPAGSGATAVWVRDALPLDAADVVTAGPDTRRVTIELPAARRSGRGGR